MALLRKLIFGLLLFSLVVCSGCEIEYYHDTFFDATNAVPVYCDVEIVNNTNNSIEAEIVQYSVGDRKHKRMDNAMSDICTVNAQGKTELKDIRIMDKDISYTLSFCRVEGKGWGDSNSYLDGFSTFSLYEIKDEEKKLLWTGVGEEKEYYPELYDYYYDDDVEVDFLYYLDHQKSGTESFGKIISTDPELNGIESGHVKIRLTISEDQNGNRICSFSGVAE